MDRIGGTYFSPDERKSKPMVREIELVKMRDPKLQKPYKREELFKTLDDALKRHNVPIVANSYELYEVEYPVDGNVIYRPMVNLKNLIGIYKGYEVREDTIYINVLPIGNTELFDCFFVSPAFFGIIKEDFVELCTLVGFFLTGSHGFKEVKEYL